MMLLTCYPLLTVPDYSFQLSSSFAESRLFSLDPYSPRQRAKRVTLIDDTLRKNKKQSVAKRCRADTTSRPLEKRTHNPVFKNEQKSSSSCSPPHSSKIYIIECTGLFCFVFRGGGGCWGLEQAGETGADVGYEQIVIGAGAAYRPVARGSKYAITPTGGTEEYGGYTGVAVIDLEKQV